MKLSGMLVAVCVISCGLCTLVLAPDVAGATFLGMTAPLVVGLATIRLVEQTVRTQIRTLTARMTMAFIVKMMFYPVYVSIVLGVLAIDPIPFAVSFTLYFVALQITVALYFKTLFARTATLAPIN